MGNKKDEERFKGNLLWSDDEEDGLSFELAYYTDQEHADQIDEIQQGKKRKKKKKNNQAHGDDELGSEDFRKFGKNTMLMSIVGWQGMTADIVFKELIDPGEKTNFIFDDDEDMTVSYSMENLRELVNAVNGDFAKWFTLCRAVLKDRLADKRLADLKNSRTSAGGGATKAKT